MNTDQHRSELAEEINASALNQTFGAKSGGQADVSKSASAIKYRPCPTDSQDCRQFFMDVTVHRQHFCKGGLLLFVDKCMAKLSQYSFHGISVNVGISS